MIVHTFKTHDIRSVLIDGEPWFLAIDVVDALALTRHGKLYSSIPDDKKRMERDRVSFGFRPGGRPLTLFAESGLYRFLLRSDKPEAREFQDWVTREVLPSIRKTGGYQLADHGRDQMPGSRFKTA